MSSLTSQIEAFNPYSPRVHTNQIGMHSNNTLVFGNTRPLGSEKAVSAHRHPFLSRLSVALTKRIAFYDPRLERVNGVWRPRP